MQVKKVETLEEKIKRVFFRGRFNTFYPRLLFLSFPFRSHSNIPTHRPHFSVITVVARKSKTRRIRRIPLNHSMSELFYKLDLSRNGNQYVFENPKTGKPIIDFKRSWQSLLKRLGIKGVRFHDLRHSFATYALLRNGGDLVSLQATLGHANISTTGRYAKALMEGQQRLVNSFERPESKSNIINLRDAVG
jgi:integrase